MRSAFFCNNPATIDWVYGQGRREKVGRITDLHPAVITNDNFKDHAAALGDIGVVFSTWGMWDLPPEQLAALPALKGVFYAAGSVKGFAEALIARNVLVMSAWGANAIPVAEFTVAQILLANKGFFRNVRACADPATRDKAFRGVGNFNETVALLGAGAVGRAVVCLLRNHALRVVVWDPFLTREQAAELGVEKVESIEEAFTRGLVVSNHLANVPATRGLLHGRLFAAMRKDAAFINTGRGATVVEDDLVSVFRARPDLTALLDVTDPEPPRPDSPLYGLPNIHITAHIAGSMGDEVVRMADFAIEEFLAFEQGRPLRWAVTPAMLMTMA